MQKINRKLLFTIALITLLSGSEAHHGIESDVDLEDYTDLSGTIELVEWLNPHVIIHLSTEDANGFNQKWLIQADSPNSLLRRGINRASFEYMSRVRIRAYPALGSPCANECFAYGYELSPTSGPAYTLHQALHEFVNQLTLPPD